MIRSLPLLALVAMASPALGQPLRDGKAETTTAGLQQINCDMLTFSGQLDGGTTRELVPAHTLDAAAAILARHNIAFTREHGTLSFGQMPKKLLDDLNHLPPGEPIILPNQDGGAICVLVPGGDTY